MDVRTECPWCDWHLTTRSDGDERRILAAGAAGEVLFREHAALEHPSKRPILERIAG